MKEETRHLDFSIETFVTKFKKKCEIEMTENLIQK